MPPYIRRSSVWSDPRVKPPFGAARIDWGHPLAQGLSGLWVMNERGGVILDAVSGRAETMTVQPSWSSEAVGPALNFNGSTTKVTIGGTIPSGTVSVYAIAMRAIDTPTEGPAKVPQVNGTRINNPAGNGFEVAIGNGFRPAPDINKPGIVTFGGGTVVSAYRDGVLQSSADPFDTVLATKVWAKVSTSMTSVPIGEQHLFGATPGTEFFLSGSVAFCAEWSIVLSAAQHLWLAAEPYAMLRPIVRRRWFVPSGAGGPTFTFARLTFGGNTVDVRNESLGAITINIVGGTTPSVENSGGGSSTTLVINPTTTTITVKDITTGAVIEGARVLVTASDNTGPMPFEKSTTITRVGATATATCTGHGLVDGKRALIKGAAQQEYNGAVTVTVVDPNTFTYTVAGSPATPATGEIKTTGVVIDGITNASGVAADTRSHAASQPITGRVRKATPAYKTGVLSGVISNTSGFAVTVQMISDE